MKKIKILLAILVFSIISSNTFSQERLIQGVVTTFDSIPLVGVTLKSKGTKQVVKTDTIGAFSISCNPDEIISVTANGYYSQKIKISAKIKFAAINLKMKPGIKNREYSVGYWTVSDKDKVNAIVGINDEELNFSQYSSMTELINGRFAGVQIVNGEIRIRGTGSINGSNAALIVLDGMLVDYGILNSLPPSQVKSIDVIKDGSASIYGARGANGVVIIETKK
jgi:TonB-dependent SusC/RagA subfamily outer membrane receptor